jgi:hypothetical protein
VKNEKHENTQKRKIKKPEKVAENKKIAKRSPRNKKEGSPKRVKSITNNK